MKLIGYAVVEGRANILISEKEKNLLAMFFFPLNRKVSADRMAKDFGGHLEKIYLKRVKNE